MTAVIIYDDSALAAEVNARLERTAYRSEGGMEWRVKPWRIDMLKLSPTMGEALTEAADAHLIVFAVQATQSIPSWLMHWLDHWAGARNVQDPALAVFSGGTAEHGPWPAWTQLAKFAERQGIRLISTDAPCPAVVDYWPRNSVRPGQPQPSPAPGPVPGSPNNAGGIND